MSGSADGVILSCLVGTGLTTYITTISQKKPLTMKPLLGIFIAGSLLLLLNLVSPDIAKGFAILLLVSALILNGSILFGNASRLTS